MERRTALALAAATAGTVLAASAAFAANVGLLRHDDTPSINVLDTSSIDPALPLDPTVVTIVVDDPPVEPTFSEDDTSEDQGSDDDGYETRDDSSGTASDGGELGERDDDD